MTRPDFIRHWQELEPAEQVRPPIMDEPFGYVAEFAAATNLSHLRVAHMRLPPGVRSHPPIASRDEDCFCLRARRHARSVARRSSLSPDRGRWRLPRRAHRHRPFASSTTRTRMCACSSSARACTWPRASAIRSIPRPPKISRAMGKLWTDAPRRKLGPHDGLTDDTPRRPAAQGLGQAQAAGLRHPLARHPRARSRAPIPDSDEQHGIDAHFTRRARLVAHRRRTRGAEAGPAHLAGRMPSATRRNSSMSSPARSTPGTTATSRPWARAISSAGKAARGITHVILNNSG